MALKSYFFNAKKKPNGELDRLYNAQDFTNYLGGIICNGIFPEPSTCLQVFASDNYDIVVKKGQAWINGYKFENTSDYILTVERPDVILNRIDRVVLQLDKIQRQIFLFVKKGVLSNSPKPPELTRNNDIWELCLAEINVDKQLQNITESKIRDTRLNTTVCGIVAGLIKEIDTSTLWKQFEDQFKSWFNDVKNTIATGGSYREIKKLYKSNNNTTEVDLPDLNFKNGSDIINIFINGMRLNSEEYRIESQKIKFIKPIDVVNTPIDISILKTIDGNKEFDALSDKVNNIENNVKKINKFIYFCSGEDDNKKLSQIAQDFLKDEIYNQIKIEVIGDLSCNNAFSGAGTYEDPYIWFQFGKINTVTEKIIFDFSNCNKIIINQETDSHNVIFGGYDVNINNINISILGEGCNTIKFFNGVNINCENSIFNGISKNKIVCSENGIFKNCKISVISEAAEAYGFNCNNNILKLIDCEIYAYNGNDAISESISVNVPINKSKNVLIVERCSIPIKDKEGYKQNEVVKINSGFYSLVSNYIGKPIKSYNGEGNSEVGTMIISK